MQTPLRAAALLLASALTLVFGPKPAEAQKALVYCPAVDVSGCSIIKTALASAYPGGVDAGSDGAGGTVDLRTADLFQYSVFIVPSLAETDSTAPYALLRDPAIADRLKQALIGRRAFWSGTPDQGVTSNRAPKDALLRNLATWASANFGTVNAPGLVVLQDNSSVVTQRYSWVEAITGLKIIADPKSSSYSEVSSLTAAGNAVLSASGATLAYANMASFGFQTPTGAAGLSLDAVGKTGTTQGGQVVLMTQQGANTDGAVVTTDKDDYPPGTPVIITGSGFGPSETVVLLFHEDPTVEPDFTRTTTTDPNGAFSYSGFSPDTFDIDIRFVLKATGQSSGRTAQTTFTDAAGDFNIKMGTAGATFALSWAVFNGSSCGGAVQSSGTVTAVGATGGTDFSKNINSGQSLRLTAGNASNGGTFSNWTVSSGPAAPTSTANPLCLPRDNNTVNIVANYQTSAATSLAVAAASGTFGGTATFAATLTSGSPAAGVGNKTISFKLNGAAVCGASPLATCPTTNSSGVATLSGVSIVGINAGTYATAISATFAGDASFLASTGTGSLQVDKANQTIAFGGLTNKQFGDPDFQVSATASSGLVVSFAASGNCSLTNNTVKLTGAGSCTITASQEGNTNYAAATAVSQTFQIGKSSVTLALSGLAATYDGTPKSVTVTTTPEGITGVSVTYNNVATVPVNAGSYAVSASLTSNDYSATPVTGTLIIARATPTFTKLSAPAVTYKATSATISGTLKALNQAATGSVSVTVAGTGGALTASAPIDATTGDFSTTVDPSTLPANLSGYDVTLSTPQTQNFEAATDNSLKLVVNKASQSITFAPLGGKTFGDSPFTVSATSTSNLSVTFSASGGACSVAGNTVTITGGGNCALTAKQAGDANYEAAQDVSQSFTVAKAKAAISVTGVTTTYDGKAHGAAGTAKGVGDADLASSLNLGDSFTNVPGGTANWTFDGGVNYESASGSVQITINRAQGSISLTGPATITYKSTSSINTNKVGDGGVTYAATTGAGSICTVNSTSGDVTMLRGTGDCGITATLAQGPNYEGATSTELTIKAAKAVATINVVGFDGVYDTQPHGASGTAKGVGDENLNAGLNFGATFTDVPGGTANWTFNGGADYENAGGSVEIKIAKADQKTAVTLTAPASMTYGQSPVTLAAAGGDGTGAYQFSAGSSDGCTLAGDALSVVNASKSCAVSAIHLGDKNYKDSPATAAATVSLLKANAVVEVKGYTDVYDGQPHGATGTATGVKGENLSSLLSLGNSFTGVPGGTANWSFSGGDNYNSTSGSAAIVITAAPLSVKANDASRPYGDQNPSFTGVLTGIKNSENITASYTTTAINTTPVGSAPIVPSIIATPAILANYQTPVVTNGTLTITKRQVTVTADAKSKVFNTPDPALTYQVTLGSVANNDPFSGALTRDAGTNVGSYAIRIGTLTLGSNYDLGFVSASLTITPAAATVSVADLVQPVGNIQGPTATATAVGSLTPVTVKFSFKYFVNGAWVPVRPSTVGVYPLQVDIAPGENYANTTPADGYFVIYDASAGFVTGGGWINSPEQACRLTQECRGASGKANFGFVSKYQNGAKTPSGNTEFQFHNGNLNFKSTSYDWLVVSGARAQYKGDGTINGVTGYKFILTGVDGSLSGGGGTDRFRIKIMQTSTGMIVYDNMLNLDSTLDADVNAPLDNVNTLLGGGSIQIKTK